MRIAHVLHGWPATQMGGTGMYVDAIAHALAAIGHEVAIVHPSPTSNAARRIDERLSIHGLRVAKPRRWRDTWDGETATWTAWCDEWKPDVVHFHHLSGFPLGMVDATPSRRVLTLHDYAIPCARGQLVTASLEACAGPTAEDCTRCMGPALTAGPMLGAAGRVLRRLPGLYSRASARVTRPSRPHSDVTARIHAAQRAIAAADAVLSPSHDLAQRMSAMGFGPIDHTALPLVNAISTSPTPPAGPVRFLYASSILPTKGPDRLIRAFRSLTGDARLTIAGHVSDFPTHPDFGNRLRAQASKDPRIAWLGPVPPEEMSTLLDRHDVLVLPSIWPENSPLIVREATRAGLSVIASTHGGARELAPSGTFIETDDDLRVALRDAMAEGRTRHTPREWPTPKGHAEALLSGPYAGDGRGRSE